MKLPEYPEARNSNINSTRPPASEIRPSIKEKHSVSGRQIKEIRHRKAAHNILFLHSTPKSPTVYQMKTDMKRKQ